MREKIFALLTAASMLLCAAPAYVGACDSPPNAQGSYDTGLANRNVRAQAVNGQTANNGQAADRTMDAISRVDADNDTAADSHTSSGWLKGGNWSTTPSTTTTTTTTTLPVRPAY